MAKEESGIGQNRLRSSRREEEALDDRGDRGWRIEDGTGSGLPPILNPLSHLEVPQVGCYDLRRSRQANKPTNSSAPVAGSGTATTLKSSNCAPSVPKNFVMPDTYASASICCVVMAKCAVVCWP